MWGEGPSAPLPAAGRGERRGGAGRALASAKGSEGRWRPRGPGEGPADGKVPRSLGSASAGTHT